MIRTTRIRENCVPDKQLHRHDWHHLHRTSANIAAT